MGSLWEDEKVLVQCQTQPLTTPKAKKWPCVPTWRLRVNSSIGRALFLSFLFNWRIVALQNCVGFCQTSTWISHRYIYVPSLLNLPPNTDPFPLLLGCHRALFELPESHSKFPLAICFTHGSVYVSMLLSPFIPPTHNSSKNKVLIWKSMSDPVSVLQQPPATCRKNF